MHAKCTVRDNNVYEAHSTDECTGRWRCGSTSKDELPKPRGFLANDMPSHVIEQAIQEV